MNSNIKSVTLQNFGLLQDCQLPNLTNINLIIGENGTGKTFFLKALYSAVRSIENYKRGDDIKSLMDILSENLRWTFQCEKLGDLVTRGISENLSFKMDLDNYDFGFTFSQSASTKAGTVTTNITSNRSVNSVFIPSKEVLSLYSVILKSREIDHSFGFDDTYYDLVKALMIAPKRGKNYSTFSKSRRLIQDVINGKVDLDEKSGKWYYKDKNNCRFSIGATSEGVKKISILDRLLGNGYLDNKSIIFIDEIEASLHPTAILKLLDMVKEIATNMDVQFFITSHSYFVIKKLALIANNNPDFVTCISLHKDHTFNFFDLNNGMPDNPIIDTSIALYEKQ